MEKLSLIQEYNLYKISDLKKQIDNFGIPLEFTIYGDKCYFYNSDLYGLFELKIEKEGIKPLDFIKYYKEGFLNGLRHLEDKEQIFERDFSDTNRRHLSIQLIKDILHSREFIEHTKGLINLIRKVSLIFTEKTIYDQGYYNGLFYSIDNLIKKKGITYEDVQPEITIDQTIKDEGHYEFKFDQNEQAFEEFITNKLSNRENIYYDKFDFDYNNETFEEFKEKFDSYRSEFNFSDLKAECNRYQNIYEVCEYKLNGKNYKEKLPDEYYKEIEIHSEFFNITNYSKTYNLSNSIILFLEQCIKEQNILYENNFKEINKKSSLRELIENKDVDEIQTKATILKNNLVKYGFLEIDKIKCLSEENQNILIKKMTDKGVPYSIAMLDYLKFIEYLEFTYFRSKTSLHKELAKWFAIKDKEGRSIRGHINSLNDYTHENKERYTAHKHKNSVKKDYQELI